MAKEYFPHDYGARLSLRGVRKDFGLEGVGFYWCFVEILHEEGGYVREDDIVNIAYDLQVDPEMCQAITHNYDLFSVKKGKISSDRVLRNIRKRAEISDARKRAASQRWDSQKEGEREQPATPANETKDEKSEDAETSDEPTFGYYTKDGEVEYLAHIEWGKKWITDAFEKWRDELHGMDEINSSGVFDIEPRILNLIEAIEHKETLTINGAKVETGKFLETLVYFFRNEDTKRQLWEVIETVDSKCYRGEVKNKQNYLISSLYNTAKMNGQ